MKDLREIKLTHQRLIKIRDNFRKLWKIAAEKKIVALVHEKSKYDFDDEKWDRLESKKQQLGKALNPSIVQCGMCNQVPGDRIWVAHREKWYCLNCYRKHTGFLLRRKHKHFP